MHVEIDHDDIDGFVTTAQVEELTGWSSFWISQKVKAKKFPAPDLKGGPGRSHRWRRSTIRRALDAMQNASQQQASA